MDTIALDRLPWTRPRLILIARSAEAEFALNPGAIDTATAGNNGSP
jgi:hypothetical protein